MIKFRVETIKYISYVYNLCIGDWMPETIRIKEDTAQALKHLKERERAKSYDEALRKLLKREEEKISMFGADKDLKKWRESDRAEFREGNR